MQKYMMMKIFFSSLMVLLLLGCDSRKAAREEIEQKGIPYNIQEFGKAINSKNSALIDLFIAAGIDVSNNEVLAAWTENTDPELLKKLLDAGMNPNSKIGDIPLIIALSESEEHYDSLKYLVDAKNINLDITADVQSKDGKYVVTNATALHQAVEQKNYKAFELLIKKGANPKLVAQAYGYLFDVSGSIFDAYFLTFEEKIRFMELMGKQFDPNTKIMTTRTNEQDYTILQSRVRYTDVKGVKILIEKGANIKVLDSEGGTLLHQLNMYVDDTPFSQPALIECKKMEKLLISNGVDTKIKNKAGETYRTCNDFQKTLESCHDAGDY